MATIIIIIIIIIIDAFNMSINFESSCRCRLAYAATLARPIYESSFWASAKVYETSRNQLITERRALMKISRATGHVQYQPRRRDH